VRQEKRGSDRGNGVRRRRATTADAVANKEAVQPGDDANASAATATATERRMQLDRGRHKGLLPETEHAVGRVSTGGAPGR